MKRVYYYGGTPENRYKISLVWNEENEAIARRDACDGNIYYEECEDDGLEETAEMTQDQRIAELEEALALLLSGVTE